MPHQILLAEDDQRLAQLVKDYLEITQEFVVFIENNGGKVARTLEDIKPDLLVLDVGLPIKDGMTVCREIRPHFLGPILMLTARNDDADQILGLECGADDYVIKPVEPRVLLARIKALLRRFSGEIKTDKDELQFGSLSIQVSARRVVLNQAVIEFSSHEFDLLILLAKMPGQTISREYLFNALYSRPYDGLDRTIDVRVSQLRKKLGDNAEKPFRIKTVWGRGYMFVEDAW
jgi:DNA-binding response OmpR family regulator